MTHNYDKYPATRVEGTVCRGWEAIGEKVGGALEGALFVDLYAGVYEEDIVEKLSTGFRKVVRMREAMKPEEEIRALTDMFMTDDVLFGHITCLKLEDFFDSVKLDGLRKELQGAGKDTLVIGTGAALVMNGCGTLVYADMARWEIQQRMRAHAVKALGVDNHEDHVSIQYKRGYFIDWRVLDAYKDRWLKRVDWWLDTNKADDPKLISGEVFMAGMEATAHKPFRVVPFFDPAPWGGQWMKEVCGLDREADNYGWCFDCVPEENSLLLDVDGVKVEFPANDLVLMHSRELLGVPVEGRFGKDFPIRFDFLDTMGGGNLSLQVHPTAQFIREQFGMPYTQDESYYIMDAAEDGSVFLGVRTGIDREAMLSDLRAAERGEKPFDAHRYVNQLPAKKHDHYLIPAGTIHCSGANTVVLEISATPNLFTFKLWDWNRMGLDGKPRPINVERGSKVIQWERDTEYVNAQLVNRFEKVAEGDGWDEIRTGLHPAEFIETHRTRFDTKAHFKTGDSVQVLNLVEGAEAVVESPNGRFEPFRVHYAETFIVPACVGEYTIRPCGEAEGGECMVIRAYIRFNA